MRRGKTRTLDLKVRLGACLAIALITGCTGTERYGDPGQYQATVDKLALVGTSLAEAQGRLEAIGYACSAQTKYSVRPPLVDMACGRQSSGLVCVQPQHIYLHHRKDEQRVEAVSAMLGKDRCL
jgi:hypothetical protein